MSASDDPPPPYEARDPAPIVAAPPVQEKQFNFYHVYRSQSGNYKGLLDDKTPSFYIKSHTLRTPDLVVHRGNGDFDRVVANCQFPELLSQYTMNVYREINNKASGVPTRMTSDGRFTAAVRVPDTTGAIVSVQRRFIWKRTSGHTLVDEETNETAAMMHGMAFGLGKCFVLETQVSYGNAFEVLMVTSAMSIYENQRREYSKSSSIRHGTKRGGAAAASQMGFFGGSMGGGAAGGF
jgi:hypothetical protein